MRVVSSKYFFLRFVPRTHSHVINLIIFELRLVLYDSKSDFFDFLYYSTKEFHWNIEDVTKHFQGPSSIKKKYIWLVQNIQRRKTTRWRWRASWMTTYINWWANVSQINELVLANRRLTILNLADDVGVSKGSVTTISKDILSLK